MNILVLAPHPDDEILGCGGTIARLAAEKNDVYVAILTKGTVPPYTLEGVERGRSHALKAHKFLGVKETLFCDLPAAKMNEVPHFEVNQVLVNIVSKINPEIMFVPFASDLHLDHQCVFKSALVAARPLQVEFPKKIYCYETLSETNWNAPYLTPAFQPNAFFDISKYLETKLQAFGMIEDQVKEFPHERSLNALRALATLRGSTVHRVAAEAFVVIREII